MQGQAINCARDDADYLVGVELRMASAGRIAVGVRALDLDDGTTVNDFSRDWQGAITSGQYRDFRHIQTDPAFRGERDVPYFAMPIQQKLRSQNRMQQIAT